MELVENIVTTFMVTCYTIVGCVGSVPQIYKTFKTKSVKDFSQSSWLMWTASSVSYLIYAIVVNPEPELLFTSIVDAGFNTIILAQVFYYRKRK